MFSLHSASRLSEPEKVGSSQVCSLESVGTNDLAWQVFFWLSAKT